jgi:predicted ester cyclase
MSIQSNRFVVHRVLEEFWQRYGGNTKVLDECFAEDYVNHELSKPPVQGVGEYKKWAVEVRNAWTKGFPDYFIAIDDLIAEGDKVAKRWTLRGTHQGEFLGVPATGK